MIDAFVLLTPIIMIGVVSLVAFVGCDLIFGLDRVEPHAVVLKAQAGDDRVDLEWNAETNATYFHVKRGETPGSEMFLAKVDWGIYEYPDLNVLNGTTYYYTVSAFGGDGETEDSNEVSATPSPEVLTQFIVVFAPGTLATAAGLYGMAVQVGANNLKVTELGRLAAAASTQTHVVKIVDAATNADFGNPVAVSMAGVAVGDYKYAAIPDATPIILQANSTYYFVTQETSPGDQFLNHNTTVGTTSDGMVTGSVRNTAGSYLMDATGAVSYGLVNFTYQVV